MSRSPSIIYYMIKRLKITSTNKSK